jgi:hypothetical protein
MHSCLAMKVLMVAMSSPPLPFESSFNTEAFEADALEEEEEEEEAETAVKNLETSVFQLLCVFLYSLWLTMLRGSIFVYQTENGKATPYI